MRLIAARFSAYLVPAYAHATFDMRFAGEATLAATAKTSGHLSLHGCCHWLVLTGIAILFKERAGLAAQELEHCSFSLSLCVMPILL